MEFLDFAWKELSLIAEKYTWFWLILAPLLFWAKLIWKNLNDNKTRPESFRVCIHWLRTEKFAQIYLQILGKLLDKLSALIGDSKKFSSITTQQTIDPIHKIFHFNPWTSESFGFCLSLAVFYPVVAFLILWVLGGKGLVFGKVITNQYGITIDPSGDPLWLVGMFIFSFILLTTLKLPKLWKIIIALLFIFVSWGIVDKKGTVSSYAYVSWFIWITCFYLGGLFTQRVIFKKTTINDQLINFTIIFSLVGIGISDPFASSLIAVIAIPVAVLSGSTVAASMIAGTILAISIGIIPSEKLGYFNYFSAIAGMLYVALNSGNKYLRLNEKLNSWYWLFIITVVILISILLFSLNAIWDKDYYFIVLFSLVLPIINAPVDWISLGVTRGLLTAIRNKHHNSYQAIIWILIDVVLALVFLIIVFSLMLITVNFISMITNSDLFSIGEFLKDPLSQDHYWLHFTVLSTLIPTLAHLMMTGGVITLWIPRRIRLTIATNLENNNFKILGAWLYLTFIPFLGIIIAPAAIYLIAILILSNFNNGLSDSLKTIINTININFQLITR